MLVAEAAGGNQLVRSVLREFVFDSAWYVPPFVALALILAVCRVRRSLRPLRAASAQASAIGPESIAIRLPEIDVPTEALPLVIAVNRALDRLEQGFALQRQFTANAAHELRTPLTIITARLDTLEGNGQLTALREEVARMNRLVEQLLCVARLDSLALDVSGKVDLHQLAEEVVGSMAHLALATGRTIALTGVEHEVAILGNAGAIGDALRNLIENGLAHTPPGTEVIVEVSGDGVLSVADSGPGIPAKERSRIFDRFWRGRASRSGGAGLGLAIVIEIVRSHGASITVNDRAPRGVRFDLRFTPHEQVGVVKMPASQASLAALQTGAPLLQVRDLRTHILKPASFSLSAGECVAVRGPSGAGKTLLLRAIADLDPNEGLVTLAGRDRSTIAGPEWRRLVGYVPAEPGWWADTVGEHFGEWTAALAFVKDLGLPEGASAWPITRLSTGERLRLAHVRALMVRPKVLLLDEPTAALDAVSVAAVESVIDGRVQAGLAVLWVTHDAEQAKRVAHRLLVAEAGQVREEVLE